MDDPVTRAKRYRDRAEEIRTLASTMKHSESQRTLLSLAEDYIHMAQTVEDLTGSKPAAQENR